MKNIEKYQNLISKGEVDALLLTSKHNRQYAAEYCIAEIRTDCTPAQFAPSTSV